MTPIDPRIHQVLDGELGRESLPPELRRDVDRLEAAVTLLAAASSGAGLEVRVMTVLRRPPPARARRLVHWLPTPPPLPLHVRPGWSLALVTVVALLTLFPAE